MGKQIIYEPNEVEQLYNETEPIPGRLGWRVDKDGKEWYSAAWLDYPAFQFPGQ